VLRSLYDASNYSFFKLAFSTMPRATTLNSPKPDSLQARKNPRQQRSLAMVALILQAATRVLQRESLAGFNTNRVAHVAGISVGSLYQYFPNKSALVVALLEQAHVDLADAVQATAVRVRGQPLQLVLLALAELAVQQQYADPVLASALDHEEKRLPLDNQLAAVNQRLGQAVLGLLKEHMPAITPEAVRDCLVITRALVEAEAGERRIPPPDLAVRVVRSLRGYLAPWLPPVCSD
jgi:AcrR family transcriptional regulator